MKVISKACHTLRIDEWSVWYTHKVNRISGIKRFCWLSRNFFHQSGNQWPIYQLKYYPLPRLSAKTIYHVSLHSELHRDGFIFKSLHVLTNTTTEHTGVSVRAAAALSLLVTGHAGNVSHCVSSCQCQMICCWHVAPTAANWLMFFFYGVCGCLGQLTDLIIHRFDLRLLWPGLLKVF